MKLYKASELIVMNEGLKKLVSDASDAEIVKALFKVRGHRLEGNKMKIQVTKGDQFKVTIPKAIARGYGLFNGSVVEFEITQRGILIKRSVE